MHCIRILGHRFTAGFSLWRIENTKCDPVCEKGSYSLFNYAPINVMPDSHRYGLMVGEGRSWWGNGLLWVDLLGIVPPVGGEL